jgi:hypothetical protein
MAVGTREAHLASHRRRFDLSELWRLALWGMAAAVALVFLTIAGTSRVGTERMIMAYAQIRGTAPPQNQNVARAPDPETQRLAETVRMLSADRDRLVARIGLLERNINDMTGSIARTPAPAAPSPALMPPETTAPITEPTPVIVATVPVPRPAPLPPQTQPASPPAPEPAVSARMEFGIDLGAAGTVEGLRVLWAAARSRHGALLEGLRPIMSMREVARPGGLELRLVAGPFANATSAARVCATLTSTGAVCQPAPFDGQRLATR